MTRQPGPKRVLIIGAGRIAGLNEQDPARMKPCSHVGSIRSQAALEAVGVVDIDQDRARAFAERFGLEHAFSDVEAALGALSPEIVTVAVPYRQQHDVALKIAGSAAPPRRLLLEKPLADSLRRATAIVEACESAGIELLVNNECIAPVYGKLGVLLRERLGNEAISASAWCSSGMHAVGIHQIGAFRRLFGDIAWVSARAETEPVESLPFSTNFTPDDPRIHGMIGFDSGLLGFLTNSALTRYTYKELEILCRGGKIRLSDNGSLLQVWTTAAPGASTISYRLSEPETVPVPAGTAFAEIGRLLAEDAPSGKSRLIDGRAGLADYRVLDALVRSAREGREIALKEAPDNAAAQA